MNKSFAIIILYVCFLTPVKAQSFFEIVTQKFLNTPYVAGTLESGTNEESLIIKLDEVDCTTFAEYVVAAISIHEIPDSANLPYRDRIQKIRYRDGRINGYLSRLHYFSDWIENNIKKGIIQEITGSLTNHKRRKKIDFMSAHPQSYAPLKTDSTLLPRIRSIEHLLSEKAFPEIKKEDIKALEMQIKPGDLIAITTSIPGLDISHVGFAWFVNGRLHLLHASSAAKKVIIDPLPLYDYLRQNKRMQGIRVLRVLPPILEKGK
ncbi:MAG: N-acetylmuramoyl-L-alanine amidase-like domain-containing protein [Bacteroidales bacterium]